MVYTESCVPSLGPHWSQENPFNKGFGCSFLSTVSEWFVCLLVFVLFFGGLFGGCGGEIC